MNAVQEKVLAFSQGGNFILPMRRRRNAPDIRQGVFYFPQPQCWQTADGKWQKSDHAFYPQGLDNCYWCGRRYADYGNEYEADKGDNGVVVMEAKCGVCEECAIAEQRKARVVFYPHIERRYMRRENGKDVTVHEYSDGVTVEGVMHDEITVKEL